MTSKIGTEVASGQKRGDEPVFPSIVLKDRLLPTKTLWYLLGVALLMVALGGWLASAVQTDFGNVKVRDVRFVGTNGTVMSGLLYVPNGVTNKKPAPGILAIHGYINSRETQDGFAIEFARRGYVVLALDQTGHGYSDGPAFANGFGGPDGLHYLRSLDIVDPKNVGMEGHSMGGWAIQVAAMVFPNDYKTMVIEGSSPGVFGAPPGTATTPRNVAVVYSKFDEFSKLMWDVDVPGDIVNGKKLKALFGTDTTVVPNKLYGSIADGTAREYYQPTTTHPQDHISPEAIGYAMDWMQQTLDGGKKLSSSDQIWLWKEIGNLIALIGAVLFLFPLGSLLLKSTFFSDLYEPLPAWKGLPRSGWWIAAFLTAAIPIITFFWFQHWSDDNFKPNAWFQQSINNGILIWALFNGAITLGLFLLWHFVVNRKQGGTFESYGVVWANRRQIAAKIGKSALLAIAIMASAYLLLAISDWVFKTDFRFWVVAVKLLSIAQFQLFLTYLLPFTAFFLVLSMALNGQMRLQNPDGSLPTMRRALLVNVGLLVVGFVVLIVFQYTPLLLGGTLALPLEPLLSIVAFQFVPLMAIVALLSTYFFRKTGHIFVGAFASSLFITWVIVAGTATQYVPGT